MNFVSEELMSEEDPTGVVEPTVNLRDCDPECDLAYIKDNGLDRSVDYILSNSFGFGGINAALVFGRV